MERKVASIESAKINTDARIERMSEIHRFSQAELDKYKILYQGTSNEQLLKVFRDLRTRVYAKSNGQNFVCMVTSVVPDGGCSYVVNNLAAAIALDKTRTSLVVDCNFYSPSVDSLIVTDAEVGLTDYLDRGDMGIESIVYASGIPRVRVIPAGGNTEGATERLSSKRMQAFLEELKSRYSDRYILIDAPSVGEYSADTRIMASLCDFVILVVPYGKVTEAKIQASIDAIGPKRLAGMVFNHL
ncbi:XRE family transcriptional regulator [Teredinibacter sp. KSP-S5-2]|uniref:XRE family transcriptional regulator n=1 Tax=Teredinibacter sp. KSP-S5-2 TaxID=3034506 RepID=UPI002934B523|nr:XRE family transcriptional regulator [Teredinibacter sp. KSP-S5-2]WNO08589.1 XRE family transcriptional regulator [Teredinibacter sp. KSP-S5-2]